MSTVDIGECRRRVEAYAGLVATEHPLSDLRMLMAADRLVVYLPLLLDEVEQLRAEAARLRDFSTGLGVCRNCGRPIWSVGRSTTGWTHIGAWQGVRCEGEITGATPVNGGSDA